MKRTKLLALCLCGALALTAVAPVFAEENETETVEAAEAEVENEGNQLSAPTDFTFDPVTGEYSFVMTDENVGYYFIRMYYVLDGVENGEYVASSKRINGGSTGEVTGTLDLGEIAWGTYHVNLVCFAPAGTDYVSPDPETITVQYGVDQVLERPEMLVMSSGDTVEFVIDWWTLCNYNFQQYMPEMKFTVYADADCTEEVMSDTVDLYDLVATRSMNPPGLEYIWGWSQAEGPHFYTVGEDAEDGGDAFMGGGSVTFAFKYDIYTYTLEPGTYYVTCQALSKDEYTLDSQVSTAVEFTLTDEECSEEYTAATTELWTDPQVLDMPGANPGVEVDRVDSSANEPLSAVIVE